VETLELIDLEALATDQAFCQVQPPHDCSVQPMFLFKTRCDPNWQRLACENWAAQVERWMLRGGLDCASHGMPRHPLDWYTISV